MMHRQNRRPRHACRRVASWAAMVVAMSAVVPFTLGSAAGADVANARSGSSSPVEVHLTGQSQLTGVSCTAPTDCTAVGNDLSTDEPFAVVESDGTWAPPATIDVTGGASLSEVSCTSPTDCTAVGQGTAAGDVPLAITETSGVWGTATTFSSAGAGSFTSVSCDDAGSCTAVGTDGGSGVVAVDTAGTWSDLGSITGAGSGSSFTSVSCTSSDDCTVVGVSGTSGLVATESSGTWSDATTPFAESSLNAVSCWSAGDCVAVGASTNPAYAIDDAGTWSTLATLSHTAGQLNAVVCDSATSCTAVGTAGTQPVVVVRSGSSWGSLAVVTVTSPGSFRSLSCRQGNCVAVGADGTGSGTGIYDVVASRAPSSPRNVTVTPASRKLKVTWAAPASHGGGPVQSYTATATPGGRNCTTAARSCVISGLANNSGFVVRVTATNSFGTSSPSVASVLTSPVASSRFISVPTVPVVVEKASFSILISGVRRGTSVAIQVSDTKRHCVTDKVGQCFVTASIKLKGEYPVIATYDRGSSIAVGIFGVIDVASLTVSTLHVPLGHRLVVSITAGLPTSTFGASLDGASAVTHRLPKSGSGQVAVPTVTAGSQLLEVSDGGVTLATYRVLVSSS